MHVQARAGRKICVPTYHLLKGVLSSGRICKMLRADRHEDQRCLCWEDSGQELAAEAPPEGEDVSGDLHPP